MQISTLDVTRFHGTVVAEGRTGSEEGARATASVEINAFAETPTFDPELFDPEEIRKARGCVLRGRLNYCGELCRSRRYMKFRTTEGARSRRAI